MATTERWGIKSYDDSGYVNLHSDYSSIVYYGEMSKNTDPVRPVYTGTDYISISEAQKTSKYDMGWLVQYTITEVNTDYMLPFYRPNYSGQQIAILDVIKQNATTWVVNVIYQGQEYNWPRLFAFTPLNTIPVPIPEANGIQVFDQAGGLVFTGNKRPLRVDDVILIQHPGSIKTGGRGVCGNDHGCHIDFNSDQYSVYTGTTTNSNTKLYHMVPSAYGGLAYKNNGSGSNDCGTIDLGLIKFSLGSREYAWIYQSWASFRGTVGHTFGTNQHTVDWLGDFAGAVHKYAEGGCKIGGFIGAFFAGVLAVFTLGASLVFFIGGALVGFALTQGVDGVPSIRAYEADQVYDTNNPSNLIVTDAAYYGIDGLSVPLGADDTPPDLGQSTYYDSFTGEVIYQPNRKYWLETYGDDGFTWLSTELRDTTSYPDVSTIYTNANNGKYQDTIIDTLSGNVFTRGRAIMAYPNNTRIYAVNKRSFNYSSSGYKWVIVTNTYYTKSNRGYSGADYPRYYLRIYWNSYNNSTIVSNVGIQSNPYITSYTYGGYTYYRGFSQKYIPDVPSDFNYESLMEYSIWRVPAGTPV
jgi:hypothetical protein